MELFNKELENSVLNLTRYAKSQHLSIHSLVYTLGDLSRSSLFVLNSAGFLICGREQPDDTAEVELMLARNGYITEEQLSRFQHSSGGDTLSDELFFLKLKNQCRFIVLIPGRKNCAKLLADSILDFLNSQIDSPTNLLIPSLIDFAIADICLGKIQDYRSITAALRDERSRPYYCPLVVNFDKGVLDSIHARLFLEDLNRIVRKCKVTRLKGHLICLLACEPNRDANPFILKSRWEESTLQPNCSFSDLESLLEKHGAHASINSATLDLQLLPELIELLIDVLDIGRRFSLVIDYERIHHLEDYQVLLIEKKYIEEHRRVSHTRALKYLLFPELLALIKHDHDTQQGLANLLFYYLLNGCDVQRTAKTLFMHKNTVYNKIKQIQELIRIDFRDIKYTSSLLDSLKLYYFMRDYFKLDVFEVYNSWWVEMQSPATDTDTPADDGAVL